MAVLLRLLYCPLWTEFIWTLVSWLRALFWLWSYSVYGVYTKKRECSYPWIHDKCQHPSVWRQPLICTGTRDVYLFILFIFSKNHSSFKAEKNEPLCRIAVLALLKVNITLHKWLIHVISSNRRREEHQILTMSSCVTGVRLSLPPCKTRVAQSRHHGV